MVDDDFTTANSRASTTYPMWCSALRKNGSVMLRGHACKIVDMTTSTNGNHGYVKVHLTGLDIFTKEKFEDFCTSTAKDYQVIIISDDFLTLMDDNEETRDLKVPEGDLGKIRALVLKKSFW
uniref:Eukaryotic translation initiation factor 5A n=1 Tax=Monopterus albus TaxID=43700 RepID=A0A3Q3J7H3_MONAL